MSESGLEAKQTGHGDEMDRVDSLMLPQSGPFRDKIIPKAQFGFSLVLTC